MRKATIMTCQTQIITRSNTVGKKHYKKLFLKLSYSQKIPVFLKVIWTTNPCTWSLQIPLYTAVIITPLAPSCHRSCKFHSIKLSYSLLVPLSKAVTITGLMNWTAPAVSVRPELSLARGWLFVYHWMLGRGSPSALHERVKPWIGPNFRRT